MLFIAIGIVAAAFGLLDYLEIVDTPTSLVLTGVGAVTLLAGIGQLQKDKRAKTETETVASNGAAATNGHALNPLAAANGVEAPAANGTAVAVAEKRSLWERLNKPVGGGEPKAAKQGKGKHRRGSTDPEPTAEPLQAGAIPPSPAGVGTPAAATAAPLAAPAQGQPAEPASTEKISFWKKLNQPVGKGKEAGPAPEADADDDGMKRRGRRRKKDQDEGPLFPDSMGETPDPFAAEAPAGAVPPAPVPVAPAHAPTPPEFEEVWGTQPNTDPAAPPVPVAPPAPATPHPGAEPHPIAATGGEIAWEQLDPPAASGEAPLQGGAGGAGSGTEQTASIATAVAEPQVEAPRRGRRVCNYCWEPNDPTASVCGSCGAAL
ncbi:MAG: zinc ribbon domain-containing protein [Actinomycetota bacterium]